VGLELYSYEPSGQRLSDTTITQLSVRNVVTQRWNSEIIWANTGNNKAQGALTPRTWDPDNNHSSMEGRYGPSLEFINLYYTDNGLPIEEDIAWDYENRYTLKTAG